MPTWSIAVDPRTGAIYVGNDIGVYQLTTGSSTWVRFGTGLPNVAVHDLDLNQTLNTLTAGTYGRSMFVIYLDDQQANSGALRAISGNNVWTGPIALVAPTFTISTATELGTTVTITTTEATDFQVGQQVTISGVSVAGYNGAVTVTGVNGTTFTCTANAGLASGTGGTVQCSVVVSANGSQELQNGVTPAQIDLVGTISDQTPGSNCPLTKIGYGNVILSGANTYGGVTTVQEGVLIVHNLQALGVSFTDVNPNACLELETDLDNVPIQLNGNGFQFNGHYTGALRNISNNNTYSGVLTLNTNSTIGVDSGSSLTITGTIVDGPGEGDSLTKELTGTLILASPDTYSGGTFVNQGILTVANGQALGASNTLTTVFNGAQLQLEGGITVQDENLRLTGSGIFDTGALENFGGLNTWEDTNTQDTITLAQDKFASTDPTPPTLVAIGALDSGLNGGLVIDVPIEQISGLLMGIDKVGAGQVVLNNANTYSGLTQVDGGDLCIENPLALGSQGSSASGTVVNAGGSLQLDGAGANLNVAGEYLTLNGLGAPDAEIQQFTVTGTNGTFLLGFMGQDTSELPYNASALAVEGALDALPSVLNVGGSMAVTATATQNPLTGATTTTYTVVFGGTLGQGQQPLLTVAPTTNSNITIPGGVIEERQGTGSRPEVQQISILNKAGSFTLTFNAQTTAALPYNASAAQVQNALNSLASINGVGGSVTVTLSGSVYTVTFGGNLEAGQQPLLIALKSGSMASNPAVTEIQQGLDGTGALQNINDNNSWGGPIILQTSTSIAASAGTQLSLTGVIQDPTATPVQPASLTKVGLGIVNLAGTNTYLGATFVDAGALDLQNSSALGGTGSEIQTITTYGSSGTYTLTFNGAPTIPLAFNEPATPLAVQAVQVTGTAGPSSLFTLTFRGQTTSSLPYNATPTQVEEALDALSTIQGPTMDGSVYVTLNGSVYLIAFLNPTDLSALSASGTGGTTALVSTSVQEVVDTATSGTFTLTFNGQPTSALAYNATAAQVQAALNKLTSINSGGGSVNVTLTGNVYTVTFFGVASPTDLTASPSQSVFVSTSIQEALNALPTIGGVGGSVQVTQTATNVFTVTFGGTLASSSQPLLTVVSAGGASVTTARISAGAGGTVVNNGATLQLSPASGQPGITLANEALTLNGFGMNNGGALENVSGANTWSNTITLGSNVSIGFDASNLTINQAILDNGLGYSLTKVGSATVTFAGGTGTDNTYTGATFVNNGTLALNKTPGAAAITGNVTVGDPTSTTNTGTLTLLGSNQIANTATVTLNYDGVFNVSSNSQTIAGLTMTGGTVNTATGGVLALNGNLTASGAVTNNEGVSTLTSASIQGGGTLMLNTPTGPITGASWSGGKATITAANNFQPGQYVYISGITGATGFNGLFTIVSATSTHFTYALATNPGTATVTGAFTVPVFLVNEPASQAAPAVDLVVGFAIQSSTGLTMTGGGFLELTADNPSLSGETTILQGTLLADAASGATVDAVFLNGGTLAGFGTVGTVTLAAATAPTSTDTLITGDEIEYNLPGGGVADVPVTTTNQPLSQQFTLNATSVALNSGDIFWITLQGNNPGEYNSLLNLTGDINLGNANLEGYVGPDVTPENSFTIISTTGTISGSFNEPYATTNSPNTVFVGGYKFTIEQVTVGSVTEIILTRELNSVTVILTSSANPSVYGRRVTFTATLTPEPGAGALPSGDLVTFHFDAGQSDALAEVVAVGQPINSSTNECQVSFDPFNVGGLILSVTPQGSPAHTLTVDFQDSSGSSRIPRLWQPCTNSDPDCHTDGQCGSNDH